MTFNMSPEEDELFGRMVHISGLCKRDFISEQGHRGVGQSEGLQGPEGDNQRVDPRQDCEKSETCGRAVA